MLTGEVKTNYGKHTNVGLWEPIFSETALGNEYASATCRPRRKLSLNMGAF